MAVSQPTVFPDVFKTFYTLLNTYVPDPLDRKSQWIFSSNPYEDLDEGKIKFPVIVIEPVNMNWGILTITKKWNVMSLKISAFSTQMAQADQLLSKICYVVNYFALNLKYESGLDFVMLTDTSAEYDLYGGTRVHVRNAGFSMRNAFKSGIGKGAQWKSITSRILIKDSNSKTISSGAMIA